MAGVGPRCLALCGSGVESQGAPPYLGIGSGGGGGAPKGFVHNVLKQFLTQGNSEMTVSTTYVF